MTSMDNMSVYCGLPTIIWAISGIMLVSVVALAILLGYYESRVSQNKCHSCKYYIGKGRCCYISYLISTFDDPGPLDYDTQRAIDMRANLKMCGPQGVWYKKDTKK